MATVAAFADVNEFDSPADDWSSFAGTEDLPRREFSRTIKLTRESFQSTPVTVLHEPCEWLATAAKSLAAMRDMEDDWDSYGAPAPGDIALANATLLMGNLCGGPYPPSRIAPSVVGGVGITLRRMNRKAYFEFDNDGRSHMLLSDEKSDPEVSEVETTETGLSLAVTHARKFLNVESSRGNASEWSAIGSTF